MHAGDARRSGLAGRDRDRELDRDVAPRREWDGIKIVGHLSDPVSDAALTDFPDGHSRSA